jgi:hypothetical protein
MSSRTEHVTLDLNGPFRFFDWYSLWPSVDRILHQDRVRNSLDIVTRNMSAIEGIEWDRDRPPSYYSDPPVAIKDPVDRYRCYGQCYSINTWAGVLGEVLVPVLQWSIVTAQNKSHTLAIGRDGEEMKLMMDLVWGPTHSTSVEEQIYAASKLFHDVQAPGSGTILNCSVSDMLDILEEGTEKRLKNNARLDGVLYE